MKLFPCTMFALLIGEREALECGFTILDVDCLEGENGCSLKMRNSQF